MEYLKPKSLAHMERLLRELPAEKRKVIVLVGRHNNERTHAIAKFYHGDWEQEGAVTVKIPSAWTPRHFWVDAKNKKLTAAEVKEAALGVPQDDGIAELLHRHGFHVPIVNLHGWVQPPPDPDEIWLEPGLYYGIGRGTCIPKQATRGLKSILPPYQQDAIHPNKLLVEFADFGEWPKRKTWSSTYAINVSRELAERPKSPGFLAVASQLSAPYLFGPNMSSDAMARFRELGAEKFRKILQILAKRGLRKSRAKS